MKKGIKQFLKGILQQLGYRLVPIKTPEQNLLLGNTMKHTLQRLKKLGIRPSSIFDVGAANGLWSQMALKYWPNATYHLIEPLKEQKEELQKLSKKHKNFNYHLFAAGEKSGKVLFAVSDDLDGSGIYQNPFDNNREVAMGTLDDILDRKETSCIVKLDTHGYELPILNGAREILKCTDAFIIEVYGFHISPTSALFHEISNKMEEFGFRLFDIVDVMRRPCDQAFWQADAIYIKSSHPCFKNNAYK